MDTFRWLATVVSIILGLGIARLLTGAITLFHARRRTTFDWLPLAWAGVIFVEQIALWWSLEELATLVPRWSLPGFLILVALNLALFVAAALVLPPAEVVGVERLRSYFERDGRWALLMLAMFNGLAMTANWVFWRQGPLTPAGAFNAVLAALAILALLGNRRAQVAAILAYGPLLIVSIVQLSPVAQ